MNPLQQLEVFGHRDALLKEASLDIGAGSPEMAGAFASEREIWRAQGKIRRL
jgi:hypothetical protein